MNFRFSSIVSTLLFSGWLAAVLPGCHAEKEDPPWWLLLGNGNAGAAAGTDQPATGGESPGNETAIQVPVDFDFRTVENSEIVVPVRLPNGEPYPGAAVAVYDRRNRLIFRGVTDAEGDFRADLKYFIGGGLRARVFAPGYPDYSFLIDPGQGQASFDRPARDITLPEFAGSQGVPADLTEESISAEFLADVNFALPEQVPLPQSHPEYLLNSVDTNLLIEETAEVWITFIHEGAGYRNSFGYFTYPEGSPPATPEVVSKVAVFPNASYRYSGGGLSTGDTVYLGRFEPGTRIGFWVIADGWRGGAIDEERPTYFSLPHLNPESDPELQKHLAVLFHEAEERIILGFEDLPRDGNSDQDFNDVVFTVRANPITAVNTENLRAVPVRTDRDGDGIADNNDAFPDDPERALVRYFPARNGTATIAFEDLFPSRGDYDFNDVVVRFAFTEILDADLKLKEVQANYELLASGAAYHNSFNLMVDTSSANVSLVERSIDDGNPVNALEDAQATGEAVIEIFPDARDLMPRPAGFLFSNTVSGAPSVQGARASLRVVFDEPLTGESAPFDHFIYRLGSRGREVHCMNKRPSARMNPGEFQSGDDASDPDRELFFRDSHGFPWALLLSDDWAHPLEKQSITDAYPDFRDWVESAGASSPDWMSRPFEGFVWR